MRVGQTLPPSFFYYDRSPIPTTKTANQTLGPVANQQLWRFSPLPSYLAIVSVVTLSLRRVTAPSTAGLIEVWAEIQAAGTLNPTGLEAAHLFHASSVADTDAVSLVVPLGIVLTSSQQIAVYYKDSSTGGTVNVYASMAGTMFNQ